MELSFIKVDPTQNTTVLVETPVSRPAQPKVAARLMEPWSVGGEQVGFIEPPTIPGAAARLQMMGGEFCGNAAMALCAVLARQQGMEQGDMTIEVSGCDAPVTCHLETADGCIFGTVNMPLPEHTGTLSGYPALFFPGIAHVIAPADDFPDAAAAERLARTLCLENDLEAAGLLLVDNSGLSMRPCVYVAGPNSVTWERGCASGSAALGAHLAVTQGLTEIPVTQPGGIITVRCTLSHGTVTALTITGRVSVTARGIAYV